MHEREDGYFLRRNDHVTLAAALVELIASRDREISDLRDAVDAYERMLKVAPELMDAARALALATDEGDDAAQGTHYVDNSGRIRCKGSFLASIEKARAAIAKSEAP